PATAERAFQPAIDIVEDDDAIVLHAEVPGMSAEQLTIEVDRGVLTLSGERVLETDDTSKKAHRGERRYGAFRRAFVLPETVDAEAVEADLKAGVLTLRIPRKAAAEKRRIEVKSHS